MKKGSGRWGSVGEKTIDSIMPVLPFSSSEILALKNRDKRSHQFQEGPLPMERTYASGQQPIVHDLLKK